MMLAAVASLLLIAGQPPAADPDPVDYEEAAEQAEEAAEATEQSLDEAIEAAEDAAEARAEVAAADVGNDDGGRICRRQSYYDDFGRQRSRKSCRPRD